ncbi:MAG: efflux RND transporter periplasmic adaptor subunit [Longimicrobiaceae bacterium]
MTDRSTTPRRFVFGMALLFALAGAAGCGNGSAETAEDAVEEHAEDEEHDEESNVVVLDTAAVAVAGIQVGTAETIRTSGLPVTGTITYDANRVSHIGPRTEGRIVRLRADIGERVRGGQALAILDSPDVGQVRAEEHEAEALLEIARENYDRERRLEQQGISSRKELLDAEAELRRAEAALQSAEQRLQALGAGHGTGGQFAIIAPFSGIVVAREASLGEVASSADQLFTVANLERLWIELDVYERDLRRVSEGQAVDVTTAAYPGRVFTGEVVYLGDILDPETRTVRARVEIPNEDRTLKPGMFANAVIQVGGGATPMVAVPQNAVQEMEGRTVVFVPGDQPGEFRAVPVEVGEPVGDGRVVIRSGLDADAPLVVAGAFSLRSEAAKGAIAEAGHGH